MLNWGLLLCHRSISKYRKRVMDNKMDGVEISRVDNPQPPPESKSSYCNSYNDSTKYSFKK